MTTDQPDGHCCVALPLEDRLRAAALGLTCSVDRCARRELSEVRSVLRLVEGGAE